MNLGKESMIIAHFADEIDSKMKHFVWVMVRERPFLAEMCSAALSPMSQPHLKTLGGWRWLSREECFLRPKFSSQHLYLATQKPPVTPAPLLAFNGICTHMVAYIHMTDTQASPKSFFRKRCWIQVLFSPLKWHLGDLLRLAIRE